MLILETDAPAKAEQPAAEPVPELGAHDVEMSEANPIPSEPQKSDNSAVTNSADQNDPTAVSNEAMPEVTSSSTAPAVALEAAPVSPIKKAKSNKKKRVRAEDKDDGS